jgi:hypothetical protein
VAKLDGIDDYVSRFRRLSLQGRVTKLFGTIGKICTNGQRVEQLRQIPGFESNITQGMQKRVNTPCPQNFVMILISASPYVEASVLNIAAIKKTLGEQNPALLSLYLGIPDCRYAEDSPR